MKGDFSRLSFRPEDNFTGVLHQQGRGLLDQDGNAATAIQRHLRGLLGRDAIGPDVVAVPIDEPDALAVNGVVADSETVSVTLQSGRAWVDGLPVQIPGDSGERVLNASYLGRPVASLPTLSPSDITAGDRDAVILEVWEESFSAFQDPAQLLEPALGGPDTTARVKLQYGLRLLRLEDDEHCANLSGILHDDLDNRGRLTATPAPTEEIDGECPVQLGGGYSGFEHHLFRIEIADPDADGPRFKWSRFNGGLVGRGRYDSSGTPSIHILANDQMINTCGRTEFYLEALVPDYELGHWRTAMTAEATLSEDGELTLSDVEEYDLSSEDSENLFFRLWDGIDHVNDYPEGADTDPLVDGIHIGFDPVASADYVPGNYWTFPARAAGSEFDELPWPDAAPPEGTPRHRAPLAVIEWGLPTGDGIADIENMHDCRRVFRPLSRLDDCCTYRVGDGLTSQGDFDSIQEAINHLPPEGGRVCVLPGNHLGPVRIARPNVAVHGCGPRSRILPPEPVGDGDDVEATVTVEGATGTVVKDLAIMASESGVGVLAISDVQEMPVRDLRLENLAIMAAADSAIKILDGVGIAILDCDIRMANLPTPWPGMFLRADDIHVVRNRVGVQSAQDGIQTGADMVEEVGASVHDDLVSNAVVSEGRGGIQVAGTSERVLIEDNLIQGGLGNGITLGSLEEVDEDGNVITGTVGWVAGDRGHCDPCGPGGIIVYPPSDEQETRYQSAGSIYDLRIERNRILDMGLNGIGVVAFFDLDGQDEFISISGLDVIDNTIRGCLQRELEEPPANMVGSMGYGGISLADVDSLRIYDNIIEDNGPDQRFPVCGIFILHSEGADISRNRIVNNGARNPQGEPDPLRGLRGGVVIVFAMPGIVPLTVQNRTLPRQNGVPALRLHGNTISQPLGQALYVTALGPVSVQDNALTSRGIVPGAGIGLLGSTVLIMNMGFSNEMYMQVGLFSGPTIDAVDQTKMPIIEGDFVSVPREGLDDANMGEYLANGNILFANNQVVTDLMESGVSFALSAVTLFSMDDVEFSDNQLDCAFDFDFLFTHTMVMGMSTRISNNRIKTSFVFSFFSIVSMGFLFNHTVDNQVTHCIHVADSPFGSFASKVRRDNLILMNQVYRDFCGMMGEMLSSTSGQSGESNNSGLFLNTRMFG